MIAALTPVFQLGGVEDVAKAFRDIKERLISYKVKKKLSLVAQTAIKILKDLFLPKRWKLSTS